MRVRDRLILLVMLGLAAVPWAVTAALLSLWWR